MSAWSILGAMWKFITEVAVKSCHSGKDFLSATQNDINV
jgi:hypothetical protein